MRNQLNFNRPQYNPAAWFWLVGKEQKLYSSAAKGYIREDAPAYAAFTEAGGTPTSTASMAELTETLTNAGVK